MNYKLIIPYSVTNNGIEGILNANQLHNGSFYANDINTFI